MTRCGKCSGVMFKLEEVNVRDSEYRHVAISCVQCGAVVTIGDIFNNAALLKRLEQDVSRLDQKIDALQSALAQAIALLSRG